MSMNGSVHSATLSSNDAVSAVSGYGLSRENSGRSSAERSLNMSMNMNTNANMGGSNSGGGDGRDRMMSTSSNDRMAGMSSNDRTMTTDPVGRERVSTERVGREKVSTERKADKVSTEPPGILRSHSVHAARKWNTEIPNILPHERVFPIQIGSELFRLSGASISSDAPSYFSQFFQCQLETAREHGDDSNTVRTLYIDRDPVTFKDISLHLQGYHVTPRDGPHFVKLFADAQFYSLPRLVSQLYEESIFISIGHKDFKIPRELFSDPGNSPNYFSLGFAVFFSTPTEVFPGLNREGLLRPPSILPPSVPNRSAETFSEILHLLRGYPVQIRGEEHRSELLRDCKYFHLKGLEQKLIRHDISFNLVRKRQEITLRLEDVRQSGISVVGDPSSNASISTTPDSQTPTSYSTSHAHTQAPTLVGFVNYARPYVDSQAYELILEIGSEETRLHLGLQPMRVEFFGDSKTRVSRLFEVIATKLNLPTTQPLGLLMKAGGKASQPPSPGNSGVSEDLVRVVLGEDAAVWVDGREYRGNFHTTEAGDDDNTTHLLGEDDDELIHEREQAPRKRRRLQDGRWGENGSGISATSNPENVGYGASGGAAGTGSTSDSWIIKTGQWRLRVQNSKQGKGGVECVLVAVKIDALSSQYGRNAQRSFLAG